MEYFFYFFVFYYLVEGRVFFFFRRFLLIIFGFLIIWVDRRERLGLGLVGSGVYGKLFFE